MLRRLILACLLALLAVPAYADMYPDASNAAVPDARYNLGTGNGCNPVTDNGADPTGVADATAAIQACASTQKNGEYVNVNLPAGLYRVNGAITLTRGQSLVGEGRGTTTLQVDQSFSPAAQAVLVLTPSSRDAGPQVKDIAIKFAQPADQSSRAAFQALGTCTSTTGGTGCKYPPAILCVGASFRPKIQNVRITNAWRGISNIGQQCGYWLDTIEMLAFETGLELTGQAMDGLHISGYHFYNFDLAPGTSNLYNGVYSDGGTFAAKFGLLNNLEVRGFHSWRGRVEINHASFWGHFTNLAMDGQNASLEVINANWVQFSNAYFTGNRTGVNPNCSIDIKNGNPVIFNNIYMANGTTPMVCVAGGGLFLNGGQMEGINTDRTAVAQTGGGLHLRNMRFVLANVARTLPVVDVTGALSVLTMMGNMVTENGSHLAGNFLHLGSDVTTNYIGNNAFNGWGASVDWSPAPIKGFYDMPDVQFQTTTIPVFNTNGDFAPTRTILACGEAGAPAPPACAYNNYVLRGFNVEYTVDVTFNANTYSTAGGDFQLNTTIPPPKASGASCDIARIDKAIATSLPGCTVRAISSGNAGGFAFPQIVSGGAGQEWSTTQVPSGATGVRFQLSGAYRIR